MDNVKIDIVEPSYKSKYFYSFLARNREYLKMHVIYLWTKRNSLYSSKLFLIIYLIKIKLWNIKLKYFAMRELANFKSFCANTLCAHKNNDPSIISCPASWGIKCIIFYMNELNAKILNINFCGFIVVS